MNTVNLSNLLEYAAFRAPQSVYINDGESRLTFQETDIAAQRVATVLNSLQVRPGDRVALLLPNVSLFPVSYYGILKMGAIPVPLNPLSSGSEIGRYLEDSGAVALISLTTLAEKAVSGFEESDRCRNLLLAASSQEDVPVPPGALRLESLLEKADGHFATAPTAPDSQALFLYTSGSEGKPKGSVLTHGNYVFSSHLLARDIWHLTPSDTILLVPPASHVFGQVLINVACTARAELRMMSRFSPEALMRSIEQDKVTFIAGVPALGNLFLRWPKTSQFDLSSLRQIMLSGAPVPSELAEELKKNLSVDVTIGYGMTEAVPISFLTSDMVDSPTASCGYPVFATQVRVVDEEDHPVPAGDPGEIVIRGPQVFTGYHNLPDATQNALRNGWFHTGDIGRFDEAGHLYVMDRLKDLIKTSGYSVYPAEVERVLYGFPSVVEAAVIGKPHETRGEEVAAFVALRPGSETSVTELMAHCRANLSSYKCPRSVKILESLPKNTTGKILKRQLQDG